MRESNQGKYKYATPGYFFCVFLSAAISVWLRTGFPVYVISGAAYDDLLFLELAISLSKGRWLGPFNQVTLAKGMFYPAFIAAVHFAGIPLKIAEQIVYLLACGLIAEFVRRRTKDSLFAAMLFGLLAFNPIVWTQEFARVLREGLYLSLSPALVLLFVVVMFPGANKSRFTLLYRVLRGCILGLVLAAYWLTREEGIWLAPALGTVLLIGAAQLFWLGAARDANQAKRSAQIAAVAVPLGVAIMTFVAGDLWVASVNYQNYGIFETNDLRSKSFLAAYGALARIRSNHWEPFVVFPKDARERAYAVSPAAAELKPWLEGEYAAGWRKSCAPCTEVQAGWFLWELRGAVEQFGQSRSAPDAVRFYDLLADEINAACDKDAIPCLPRRDTMSPPFRPEYLGQSFKIALRLAKDLLTLQQGPVGSLPSVGTPEVIATFSKMVGGVNPPQRIHIEGWAGAASGTPTLGIVSSDPVEFSPESSTSSITILPANDIVTRYPAGKAVRFKIETSCAPQSCQLIMEAPGMPAAGVSLAKLTPNRVVGSPEMMVKIEQTAYLEVETRGDGDNQPIQVRIAAVLARAYSVGLPILALLGALGVVLLAVHRKLTTVPMELLALVLASAVAVMTRVALLSYIAASSFPAASILYVSPALPFLMIFAVTGIYCGYATFSSGAKNRSLTPREQKSRRRLVTAVR